MSHDHDLQAFRYCPLCATELTVKEKGGKLRPSCPSCRFTHFANPPLGAIVVVIDKGKMLLVLRGRGAIRSGFWAPPGGHVDAGDGVRETAVREVAEETGLEVSLGELLAVETNWEDPRTAVTVWFGASLVGGKLAPADDAVDAGWFSADEFPDLAFEADRPFLLDLLATSDRIDES